MTLQQELGTLLGIVPDDKLIALRPLIYALADNEIMIESDLTAEEMAMIDEGMAEYKAAPETFMTFEEYLRQEKEE